MKSFVLLLLSGLLLGGLTVRAQTSLVVFPQLLSSANSILMTNAEFRCTVGSKLFFQSGDDEHGFEAETLATNVLSTLGLTLDGLKDAQAKMDAQKHMAAAQYQQWLAARAQQEQQAAAAQAAAVAANAAANGSASTNGTSSKGTPRHNRRSSG